MNPNLRRKEKGTEYNKNKRSDQKGLVTSWARTSAFQMHGPDFNLSDRDLKKREEKELGVGAYIRYR